MKRYVIDADGEVGPGDAAGLRRLLGCDLPDSLLRDHAVIHGHLVLIDHHGNAANVYLQAEDVPRPALAGLLVWLNHAMVRSIIVYDYGAAGYTPILQSRKRVMRWLDTLLPRRRAHKNCLRSRPVAAEHSALAPLAQAFLEVVGGFESVHDLEIICNEMFRGRYTISRFAGDGNTMIIQSLGHGYDSFDGTWTNMARGCRPQDGPDYDYGLWVAESHGRALRANRLLFDDVDAVINRPRLPAIHVTYTRCIVPFRLRTGPCYVLSASATRDDIDLRC